MFRTSTVLALVLTLSSVVASGVQAQANKNSGNSNTPTVKTKATPTTNKSNSPFVSGKVYVVTSSQKTIQFAGKDIVLPQGIQFQIQDGYLIITLPTEADRNVAVVRLGKTYLVVTKTEQLVLDPTGAPRTPRRSFRKVRAIRRGRIIRAVDEAPEASPVRP